MTRILLFAGLLISTALPAVANSHVNNNLNAADQMWRNDMDGCGNVTVAILAANSPGTFGPVSSSQRSEVARYARKCNLRF